MFAVGDRLLSSPLHEGNLFTLLHVSVCAEILKALQKKEEFLSHSGVKKKFYHYCYNCMVIPPPPGNGGFGGLGVACWPLVPKFAGSNPAEAVGFLRAKKSSARLPSEGK